MSVHGFLFFTITEHVTEKNSNVKQSSIIYGFVGDRDRSRVLRNTLYHPPNQSSDFLPGVNHGSFLSFAVNFQLTVSRNYPLEIKFTSILAIVDVYPRHPEILYSLT